SDGPVWLPPEGWYQVETRDSRKDPEYRPKAPRPGTLRAKSCKSARAANPVSGSRALPGTLQAKSCKSARAATPVPGSRALPGTLQAKSYKSARAATPVPGSRAAAEG